MGCRPYGAEFARMKSATSVEADVSSAVARRAPRQQLLARRLSPRRPAHRVGGPDGFIDVPVEFDMAIECGGHTSIIDRHSPANEARRRGRHG